MLAPEFTLLPVETKETKLAPYLAARKKITRLLVQYTLIESYQNFRTEKTPYPFVSITSLKPGAISTSKEYALHNSALVILIDGELPENMRKHFRCRESNRMTKKNLVTVASDLPCAERYESPSRYLAHEKFEETFHCLLPLDFALLVQQPREEGHRREFQLTHFHVKVERLMDNALRSIGTHLNYLQRSLYEHGEEFADFLERKFFEYFNFYHNAAGRRSAAALAAQLLAREKLAGTIFITSQQDRKLSLLIASGENQQVMIEQYVLLSLNMEDTATLKQWGKSVALDIRNNFIIHQHSTGCVVLLRLRYEHTDAALPSPGKVLKTKYNIREKWVRLVQEAIVSPYRDDLPCIDFPVVYRHTGHPQDGVEKPSRVAPMAE
jgi:hypothetical protein